MKKNMELNNCNILIIGQLKTSRTETLEVYLKERTGNLAVIGLMSPFATYNEARCTLYENGTKKREFYLPSFSMKKVTWWNKPLMCLSFMLYIIVVFIAVLRLRRKFHVFIGIATFSSMIGLILKKAGKVQRVIYYCLDYYPPPQNFGFNQLVNTIYKKVDTWIVKDADMVWEISPRIKKAREHYAKVPADSYKEVIVPLGYAGEVSRNCPFEKKERWTLGFVGTLSENQGLQLVVAAMPRLVEKFPEIKVRIIGHGPYASKLKKDIQKNGLESRFILHGFLHDDNEVYDILSHCMIGLATWTGDETDNSLYADPGKPKLYALLGLPVIITSATWISQLIAQTGAGEVINYSVEEFIFAVEKIITNDDKFLKYLDGVKKFIPFCKSGNIFDQAFLKTIPHLWDKKVAEKIKNA